MKDLDDHGKLCEQTFGLISGMYIMTLHQMSVAAGSSWDFEKPETMEIFVNKDNAQGIYEYCKAIRSGYDIGLYKGGMAKVKAARLEAHKFLYEEANDPNTSIERKIELVKITGKGSL